MRTKTILFACLLILSIKSNAQSMVAELFSQEDMKYTWLGVDFSNVKVVGGMDALANWGEKGPGPFTTFYCDEWNKLFVREGEKYDIRGMLRIDRLGYNYKAITQINAEASIENMYRDREPDYTQEDIQGFIQDYDFGITDGIGIMYVAESMNKMSENMRIHLVAINLSNNNIMFSEMFETPVGGHGLVNYWARGMYEVVVQVKRKRYKAYRTMPLK